MSKPIEKMNDAQLEKSYVFECEMLDEQEKALKNSFDVNSNFKSDLIIDLVKAIDSRLLIIAEMENERLKRHNEKLKAPETLDELFQFMKTNKLWYGAKCIFPNQLDWTQLPTFGGDEPTCEQSVWSWDEHRIIVGRTFLDVKIVNRKDS